MLEVVCTVCGNGCFYMGTLGVLDWFRCRGCGMEYNQLAEVEHEETEE